ERLSMPYKFNDARRDKFPKARYAVANWSEYNEALRARGDVTIWLEHGAAGKWRAPKRKGRGGQPTYSDFAIEACRTLGLIFHQPLRQTQGFVRSLLKLMGLDLPEPDFSTLSRRAIGLSVVDDGLKPSCPITLIVDSTGLKIHRGSGWQEEKHGSGKTRKSWRKLHIGYDPDSGEIVASMLTTDQVGDETALPELIAGIDNPVGPVSLQTELMTAPEFRTV
ncbi:IS5 family transposase, partial [uncultured Roseibium sp.]|uniref:IS5 family transposase n=2 Tax=uncultured Roseibium sp. TaxID=1936171 RepID=UPI00261B53D4